MWLFWQESRRNSRALSFDVIAEHLRTSQVPHTHTHARARAHTHNYYYCYYASSSGDGKRRGSASKPKKPPGAEPYGPS